MAQIDRAAADAQPLIEIGLAETHGWTCHRRADLTLWFKGHLAGDGLEGLLTDLEHRQSIDRDAVERILAGLEGHWALVAVHSCWALAAVDRVRSIPLIWARDGDRVVVDQVGPRLARHLGLTRDRIDPIAALSVALSGFTIGDDTLYREVRQIGPGGFVLVDRSETPLAACYHQWTPWRPKAMESAELAVLLKALNARLIEDLIKSANGRNILVPLSAGLDSRFIASGLRAAGYDNVTCFAYGISGNREAAISRQIAQQLGYPWHFVRYTNAAMRAAFASDDHAAFRASADSLTGIHFPQDYLALTGLIERGLTDRGAIVVNGQSGDFISGNHVPAALVTPGHDRSVADRRDAIVDALLAKHFKQWAFLQTRENLARLSARLRTEIDAIGMPQTADGDHGVYEFCEFQDRQSKYVVGGQRLYEHLGLEWRLPLWDQSYLDFWAEAPLTAKIKQGLYERTLRAENWGGVWDIPVNPTRIRPLWLLPVRLGLKALHAPLGRAQWHAFERRYLAYWMSPICPYGGHKWMEIARDGRGHWSGIAWHIDDYLTEKGVSLDALAA